MKNFVSRFLTLGTVSFLSYGVAEGSQIRYPNQNGLERFADVIEVLETAVKKTESKYGKAEVKPTKLKMNEARYKAQLDKGKFEVIWSGANKKLEKDLHPIRVPLKMGLLGYRIFLIDQKNQSKFPKGMTESQLKKLTVGQGKGWGDVAVFNSNGYKVKESRTYEGLFGMTCKNRFDYFSRGIGEAPGEYASRHGKHKCLQVEKNVLLFYPWPYFLYVSHKTKGTVGKRLEEGLNMMVKDGSLEKILLKYNEEAIKTAKLSGRTLIKVKNLDYLSKETAALEARKELWFDPFK